MVGLHPGPGAMRDLPLVTVEPGDLLQACQIAKESPGLNANQLLCLACVDYQEHFQLVYFLRSLGGPGEPVRIMVIKANLSYEDPAPLRWSNCGGLQSGTSAKPETYSG